MISKYQTIPHEEETLSAPPTKQNGGRKVAGALLAFALLSGLVAAASVGRGRTGDQRARLFQGRPARGRGRPRDCWRGLLVRLGRAPMTSSATRPIIPSSPLNFTHS